MGDDLSVRHSHVQSSVCINADVDQNEESLPPKSNVECLYACVQEMEEEQCPQGKVRCPHCPDRKVMWRQNLKVHISRAHTPKGEDNASFQAHEGACVDKVNGIYLVSETATSVQHLIHVQKLICGNAPALISCESKECVIQKTIRGMSGEPTFEQGVTLVSAMIPKYATARWVFVSVWTGYRKSYCLLERVIFTFDKQDFKLVCKCSGSSRIGCVQKPIARWYLRTVYEDLFLERVKPSRNLSDGLRMSFSVDTEYLYHSKRISVNQSMPLSTFHLI